MISVTVILCRLGHCPSPSMQHASSIRCSFNSLNYPILQINTPLSGWGGKGTPQRFSKWWGSDLILGLRTAPACAFTTAHTSTLGPLLPTPTVSEALKWPFPRLLHLLASSPLPPTLCPQGLLATWRMGNEDPTPIQLGWVLLFDPSRDHCFTGGQVVAVVDYWTLRHGAVSTRFVFPA